MYRVFPGRKVQRAMRGLAIVLSEPWMAAFYNTTNVSYVQELCSANEARNCSADRLKSKEIVVAWCGQHKHSLCKVDTSVNTLVCHPEDSDTTTRTQSTSLMERVVLLLNRSVAVVITYNTCTMP